MSCNLQSSGSNSRGPGYSEHWKFWVTLNFEYSKGALTFTEDVIKKSQEDKENLPWTNALTGNALGSIVAHLWPDRVKFVKRGPRTSRRFAYLNMKVKENDRPSYVYNRTGSIEDTLQNLTLPVGWNWEMDRNDLATLYRREKLDFNGNRVSLELTIEKSQEWYDFNLKSHGSAVNVNTLLKLKEYSFTQEIMTITNYLNRSSLCRGIPLNGHEDVIALIPHTSGQLCDLSDNEKTSKRVAFSSTCKIVASGANEYCASCGYLKVVDSRRKARKELCLSISPACNKRYLTKEEVIQQLKSETKARRNAEIREAVWKKKFFAEAIQMDDNDEEDLFSIFKSTDKGQIPPDMKCLWDQQQKILQTKSKNGYRWHPKIIRLCIDLYCKNPHVMDTLRTYIKLPSNKTIRMYKNRVQQEPGWKKEILEWCKMEAKSKNLKEHDFWGGLVIDEMKIQENLEMIIKNGKHRIVGFVDLGEAHDAIECLNGKTEPSLATHVLQFIFLSDCGFRFPIAQFPSGHCTPTDLYMLFWKGVLKMRETGFSIYWCILDGADCNRQFINIHFESATSAAEKNFVTRNPFTGDPMVFLMDCKHNFKKIRNNIEKSNKWKKPRHLILEGKSITWKMLKDAFNWDQSSFSLPLHERLTLNHFELDPSTRMRNHLAEDVLDKKMLFLLQKYQEYVQRKNTDDEDGSYLDSVIKLLRHTSEVIDLFDDKCPIRDASDSRLKKLHCFYKFMLAWKQECGEDNSKFVSSKLWFDIQSMCLGFQAVVAIKLKKFPHSTIKPVIANQDCVENHFCQVRSCNGQNSNPTYHQQESTQNSIRFGQTTISRKSNTRTTSTELSACSLPKKTKLKHK